MAELTALHWVYLFVVLLVIVAMIFRREVVLPSILGIIVMGLIWTKSFIGSAQIVFKALLVAGTSLFDIILVISLMVSMLKALQSIGADTLMVAPAKKLMKSPTIAYFALTSIMFIAATFFWPTPAVALVGTILVPIAISAGLPPIVAAMAINIAGHGTALAGDLVLQGAPALTAKSAGVAIEVVLTRGWIFSWLTGGVAILVTYFMMRKEIVAGRAPSDTGLVIGDGIDKPATAVAKFFGTVIPLALVAIVGLMIYSNINATPSNPGIKGGSATALLGGTAALFMLLIAMAGHKVDATEKVVGFIREGFLFAVKIFAPVIPIAGFFFLGSPTIAPTIMGAGAPGCLFDLGSALAANIPLSAVPLSIGVVAVSIMTGLDGSGFSGLPLIASLSSALGEPAGVDVATLAALGQVSAIFSGGGCLIPWAFGVAVDAGIAGVNPTEVVRRNIIPVGLGLLTSMVVACVFFM